MDILGIETSCDETAVAVIRNGREILSSVVASSMKEHAKHGGIIPEIASRRQLEYLNPAVKKALSDAKLNLKDIDAIAVTKSPGLIGPLLVGVSFARALSFAINKPLIMVNHINAHLYANFLSCKKKLNTSSKTEPSTYPELPAVGLAVSGGHTSLYYIKNFTQFHLLGQAIDDAAGEAFDKVARILGLGYPGGPIIDRLSRKGKGSAIRFTCAPMPNTLNFSFSGIKTAVLYYYRSLKNVEPTHINQISYAFQESIVSVLVKKCITACLKLKTKTLVVGGGVAANSSLRKRLTSESKNNEIKVHFPPLSLCMDNAAMIAGLGFHLLTDSAKKTKKSPAAITLR